MSTDNHIEKGDTLYYKSLAKETKIIHETHEEGGLLTINGTLVVIVVSFIIFAFIMQRIFYAPISKIREKRRNYIDNINNEAEKAALQSEAIAQEYVKTISKARNKAAEHTAEIIDKANSQKLSIVGQSKQKAEELLSGSFEEAQKAREQAFETLKTEIAAYALAISSKVLGEEVAISGISPEIIEKAFKDGRL